MSLRFQRRIKLFPGLHLNLSRSGVGLSAGGRGFHVGVDSRKRPYVSAGIPGTGVSWREVGKPARPPARPSGNAAGRVLGFLLALLVLAFIGSIIVKR